MDDRWLSVDEIADYLGVAKDTIYTWVTSKGMPGHLSGASGSPRSKIVDAWGTMAAPPPAAMTSTTRGRAMSKPRPTQDNNDMSNPDQETQAPEALPKRWKALRLHHRQVG